MVLQLLSVTGNHPGQSESIVYTRDQLSKPVLLPDLSYKGDVGGMAKQTRYKPSVLAIIMRNVRSLSNMMDELAPLVKTQREFRKCRVMCFVGGEER